MNQTQSAVIHAGTSATVQAAIVGMGTWGQNLVNHVQGRSDVIRFTTGATRTPDRAREFAARHGIAMQASFEAVLADPSVDAVVLATPHTMHAAASTSSPKSRSASRSPSRPPRSGPAPSTR
jgi:predicted dehydrogenase